MSLHGYHAIIANLKKNQREFVNNTVTNNIPILARPPGSASFVLDGTSLDDVYLSAWHISNANLTKLAGILANGSFVINATVDPFGEFLDIRFTKYSISIISHNLHFSR